LNCDDILSFLGQFGVEWTPSLDVVFEIFGEKCRNLMRIKNILIFTRVLHCIQKKMPGKAGQSS
jgi:hypothetical protein